MSKIVGKLYVILYGIGFFGALVISFVAGIAGTIIYHLEEHKNSTLLDNISRFGIFDGIYESFDSDAVSFMYHGRLIAIVSILICCVVLAGIIVNMYEHIIRTVFSAIISTLGIGSFMLLSGISIMGISQATLQARYSMNMSNVLTIVGVLGLFGGLLLCFVGTEGGLLVLKALIALIFHTVIMPLIMIGLQNLKNSLIFILILAAIVVGYLVLCVVGSALAQDSTSGSLSSSRNTVSKAERKRKERISYLERENKAIERNLEAHKRGAIGTFHVDVNATKKRYANNKAEIDKLS